ncbi:MAG: NAD(P)/FAD-dependent oxidoreductase [Spirochaetaceae bacterium]|jgi:NADPH-dependent 2,4-dienoyl-CoA reductase/sulfur reductase-like enzyme|nr:NAD(P)/FAD-dependent oxidoreductase [Spirochaetaceae bacterium]
MKTMNYDAAVIGAGAAGLAAALELDAQGLKVALIDREDHLGGILMQCIHNGFGLQEFKEELSGPEFAERFIVRLPGTHIDVRLNTTVLSFDKAPASLAPEADGQYLVTGVSEEGIIALIAKVIILSTGCREKNRGNIRIPGSRPAGVFTAGLAQRLVNIEGYIPGKEVVVIGSGDIGLIMARRMTWIGCKVKAVVEIMPYPAGLNRNIVQCLNDFDIPLYLSSQTTNIFGNDRVEGIEVTPMEGGMMLPEKTFRIDCDTVLLSVGLVPENELARAAGVELSGTTGGALVNSRFMTNLPGVFSCGNALQVHDLVDWVVEEARRTAACAAAWIKGDRPKAELNIKAGANVRYVNPVKLDISGTNKISLRSMVVKNDAVLEIRDGDKVIKSIKERHVQPSEMINIPLGPNDLEGKVSGAALEVRII